MKAVLVVDDQRDVADSVAMILRLCGYEVRVAYDAKQALGHATEWRPDAVVIDLGMPIVSGYEIARRLRALHGSLLRLVAHSAWNDEDTKRHALAEGFNVHVAKPASVPELISAIG